MKKLISILLTITMLLGIIASMPVSVSATTDSELIYTYKGGSWRYKLTYNGCGCIITGWNDDYTGDIIFTDILIPSSIDGLPVVGIEDYAFYGSSLGGIMLPEKMDFIGDYAFAYSDLTYIRLPGYVGNIGDYAFANCGNLRTVDLPGGMTTIGEGVFSGCRSLTYLSFSDDITDISDYAFFGCNITSLELPDSVENIGAYAFAECWRLTNVKFPDNNITIAESAFYYCDWLTSITLPSNLQWGDVYQFRKAFLNHYTLANIEISSNNKNYFSVDGVLFEKTENGAPSMLVWYPAGKSSDNYTIPENVTIVDYGAFAYCKKLNSVIIPDGVTTIWPYAFDHSSLTSITISDSVTTVANNAFQGCYSLSDVYYTGSKSEWNSISISLYNECLTNATIHFNYGKSVAGDINGDGEVAVNDVIYVLKYVVGNAELTDEQIAKADLSGDSKITILDAIMLQKLILEVA